MKNKLTILLVLSIVVTAGLGCGLISRFSSSSDGGTANQQGNKQNRQEDKTTTDRVVDVTVGDEKIGVPECDELFDLLAEQSKDTEDNYVVKATRQYFLNKIRESVKKSLEENKNDPVKAGKECKEYKAQLDKFKAEENSNK
jgi:hypothetical protein